MLDISQLLAAQDGNRRYDKRIPWSREVRFRIDKGPFQRAKVEDVSRGGFRLVLPRPLAEGVKVQILYRRPDCTQQHWVEGQVRWTRELAATYLTGIEIEYCSSSDQGPYEKLLSVLEAA